MRNNVVMGVIRGKVGVQLGSGTRFLGSQQSWDASAIDDGQAVRRFYGIGLLIRRVKIGLSKYQDNIYKRTKNIFLELSNSIFLIKKRVRINPRRFP
jgi:hypothetical protein